MGSMQHAPDLYLDELHELLTITCGVDISEATIWRTLKWAGFTMKKVHLIIIIPTSLIDCLTDDKDCIRTVRMETS